MQSNIRLASIAMVVGALFLTGCAKSPEKTVEGFYRAVGAGELSEAKGYLSARIVQTMGEAKVNAALTNVSTKIQGCGGIKTVDVAVTGQGEIRSGSVTMTFNGACEPHQEKAHLVKEDGDWKISAGK